MDSNIGKTFYLIACLEIMKESRNTPRYLALSIGGRGMVRSPFMAQEFGFT